LIFRTSFLCVSPPFFYSLYKSVLDSTPKTVCFGEKAPQCCDISVPLPAARIATQNTLDTKTGPGGLLSMDRIPWLYLISYIFSSSWRARISSPCCLALDSSSSSPCPAFLAIAKSVPLFVD
ncbi:hypothetical protein STEG23_029642, partial [Scotinomys teguina]